VADPFDRLAVEAGAADITVRYGDVGQAHIDFTAGDTGLTETHTVDDGQLLIELSRPGWRPFDLSLGATEGATIDVLLPEADQGLAPALELISTAGDMDVSGFFGDTTLTSTAGDILITGAAADLTLATEAGAIDARNIYVAGELHATNTLGSDPHSTYPYRFSSAAGDITITQRR
jgi:hypothetical protein